MSGHAFSSPSAASRTEKCAAAPLRTSIVERRNEFLLNYVAFQNPKIKEFFTPDNKPAEHGTYLHNQLEALLVDGIEMDIEDAYERDGMQRIAADIKDEMSKSVDYGVETKLFNDGVNSHGSADSWMLHDGIANPLIAMGADGEPVENAGNWLHIRDLKTGRTEVLSEGNSQGLRYACGLMQKFEWAAHITHIKITIDAFRFPSSSWVVTRDELIEYFDTVFRPAMYANNAIAPVATPGDHCTWCEARPHCAEFLAHAGSDVPEEVLNNDFTEVDTEVLEDVYSKALLAKGVVDKLKAELILRESAADFTQQGGLSRYKIKEGAKASRVQDAGSVVELLQKAGVDESEFYKKSELIGASALRKLDAVKADEKLAKQLDEFVLDTNNKPSLIKK